MTFQSITHSDILANVDVYKRLVDDNDNDSDLSRLIRALERGSKPILAAWAYVNNDNVRGWAVGERFETSRRTYVVLNVYVDTLYRGRGVGTKLVQHVLDSMPNILPLINRTPEVFWDQFGGRVTINAEIASQ